MSSAANLGERIVNGIINFDDPMFACLLDDGMEPVRDFMQAVVFGIDISQDTAKVTSADNVVFEIPEGYRRLPLVVQGLGFFAAPDFNSEMLFSLPLSDGVILTRPLDTITFPARTLTLTIVDSVAGGGMFSHYDVPKTPPLIEIDLTRKVRVHSHGKTQDKTPSKTEVRTRRVRTVGRRQNPGRG